MKIILTVNQNGGEYAGTTTITCKRLREFKDKTVKVDEDVEIVFDETIVAIEIKE